MVISYQYRRLFKITARLHPIAIKVATRAARILFDISFIRRLYNNNNDQDLVGSTTSAPSSSRRHPSYGRKLCCSPLTVCVATVKTVASIARCKPAVSQPSGILPVNFILCIPYSPTLAYTARRRAYQTLKDHGTPFPALPPGLFGSTSRLEEAVGGCEERFSVYNFLHEPNRAPLAN